MTITPKPVALFTAENIFKESVLHFFLLKFNFPFEATICIPQLRQALELLLMYKYVGSKRSPGMKELVQEYGKFSKKEEQVLLWLTKKRNLIVHKGEVHWEEFEHVRKKLQICFTIIAKLFEDFQCPLNDFLEDWQQKVALGIYLMPTDEAFALIVAARQQSENEPDIALDIANEAFEVALRGFAKGWGRC